MNVNTSWTVTRIGDDTLRYEQRHTYAGDIVVDIQRQGDDVVVTRGADHAHQSIIDHAESVLKGD